MLDIINYFIGGLEPIFNWINPDWREYMELRTAFALSCTGCFLAVLVLLMATIKSAFRALITCLRGD